MVITKLRTAFTSSVDTLGHASCKHQDWIDENDEDSQGLLEDKHRLYKDTSSVSKKGAYNNICETVQSRLKNSQDSCLSKNAEEIQSFADETDT